jgi:hypothetical protein
VLGLPIFVILTILQSPPAKPAAHGPPDVAAGVAKGREELARYVWRLKTDMKVNGSLRISKVEDVHLGPDGRLVMQKTVRFERKPQPTPLPYSDPRNRYEAPPSVEEEERLFDTARDLMQFYASLSPDRVAAWIRNATVMPHDPERAGREKMHGRGLGRPEDDAVVYLDPETHTAVEIEVKTSVSAKILQIAFLRVLFEPLPTARTADSPPIVPKRIFMNLDQGRRHVTLEMETSDFRTWP